MTAPISDSERIGAGDGAHLSSDGYAWASLIYAPLTALIEAAE